MVQAKTNVDDFSKFDIFISYKRDTGPDSDYSRVADELQNLFENRLAIPTFIDRKRILTGEDFEEKIRAAVKGVKLVICLLSDQFMESTFCNFEMNQAINQDKFIPFSVQSGFDASRWKIIGRTNVPTLIGWRGEIRESQISDHLEAIFSKLDRPTLKLLCELLEQADDSKILDWCARYESDPACQFQRRGYLQRRLDRNDENNRQRAGHFKRESEDMDQRLKEELRLIREIESEIDSSTGITRDHIRKLREIEDVDLTEHASASKLRIERERDRLKTDVEGLMAEIEKLKGDVAEEKARYKLLERELDGGKTPGHDEIDNLVRRLPEYASESLTRHVREAYRFKTDASDIRSEAEDLKAHIASLIKQRSAQPKEKAPDGSFIMYHRNRAGSEYAYLGCLEFSKHRQPGPHKVWGAFNEFGKFRGVGVIEFRAGGRLSGTYYGHIDGVEPKLLSYGVYEFPLIANQYVSKWEGSTGTEGKGRLDFVNGKMFWGQVLNPAFGVFEPHGMGLMEFRDTRRQDPRHRQAGVWESGTFLGES